MLKHEFYADPTVFDHLQSNAGNWLCSRFERFCPYAWVTGFCLFAAIFLLVAVCTLSLVIYNGFAAEPLLSWNQSLASGVVVIGALIASQVLLQRSVLAWPTDVALPRRFYVAARFIGLQQPLKVLPLKPSPAASARPRTTAAENRLIQEFFAGVRAAGVNVAIARALFEAGVRCADQLRSAPDSQLLEIRGVGAATVHKLRVQFGASPDHAAASSGQLSSER
jgi:hypothetical protein